MIIQIIGWIILYFFWCKNKLCFKKDLKAGNCKLVLFSFSLLLYFGNVLSSIFGIIYLNKSKKSIDSSTCSLILFFENFINGEEKNSYPKWSGTNNIYNSFLKTKDFINNFNTGTVFGATYTQLLDNEFSFITHIFSVFINTVIKYFKI